MGPPDDTPRKKPFPWLFPVLLLTFLAYAPSARNDFTFDDRWVAMGQDGTHHNEMVAELQPLSEYFSSHYWRGTSETGRLFRPITILSFALRHAVFGDDPRFAHVVNLLLHVLATALVYGLLRSLLQPPRIAAVAALFFGLHAIHSEVVATVVGRAELLSFCFGLGGTLIWASSRSRRGLGRVALLGSAAACFFVAFGAKESALAWLPMLCCYGLAHRWVRPPELRPPVQARSLLCDAAVLVTPALVILGMRANMLANIPDAAVWSADFAVNPIFDAPATSRILTAIMVWGLGLLLTALPFSLSADWGLAVLPRIEGITEPAALLALLALAGLAAVLVGGLWRAPRRPLLFLGAASFLGMSFLVSNVAFPIGTLFGERTYYAPSLAIPLLVAAIASQLRPQHLPAALLIAGAWLGASTSMIAERNEVWRDNETLIQHEVRHQPRSVRMRSHAALFLEQRGHSQGAIEHLEHAVHLDPAFVNGWHRLGDLYAADGEIKSARACYRRALEGRPLELLGAVEPEIRAKLDALPLAASPGR